MTTHHSRLLLRLLIVILSFFSFGFVIETPESIREHEKEVRRWQKQIKKAYDLTALRAFLDKQIKEHPNVEGIDLTKSKVTEKWNLGEGGLSCGNWNFSTPNPKSADFSISWTYEDKKHPDGSGGISKSVDFNCRRKSKTAFELVTATRTEGEYILLTP